MAILRIKDENGNLIDIPAIKGDKGDKGDKGERGEKGEKGDVGTVDLTDYVKNTDYATQAKVGLCKGNAAYGTYIGGEGVITLVGASEAEIDAKENQSKPITPYRIDYAVKRGLTANGLTLTDAEQASAQNWLGITQTDNSLWDGLDIITEPSSNTIRLGNNIAFEDGGSYLILKRSSVSIEHMAETYKDIILSDNGVTYNEETISWDRIFSAIKKIESL